MRFFRTTSRSLAAIAASVALLAGVAISSSGGFSSATPAGPAAAANEPSVFVPVDAYQTFDSRDDDRGRIVARQDGQVIQAARRVVLAQLLEQDPGSEPQIPTEATGVNYSITVVQPEATGFVQVAGWLDVDLTESTIAWAPGSTRLSSSGTARLTASSIDTRGYLGIIVGGETDANAHVILDITGYYIAAE